MKTKFFPLAVLLLGTPCLAQTVQQPTETYVLNNGPGTQNEGSANAFGQYLFATIVADNSLASEEDATGLDIATQTNPSDYVNGITRDGVGRQMIGRLETPAGTLGRDWAYDGLAVVFPGSDGLALGGEDDVNNWGTDQPSTYTPTSKYGHLVVGGGAADVTAAYGFLVGSGGAKFHRGYFGETWALEAGAPFLELRDTSSSDVFSVDGHTGAICQSAGAGAPKLCSVVDSTGSRATYTADAQGNPVKYLEYLQAPSGNLFIAGNVDLNWKP